MQLEIASLFNVCPSDKLRFTFLLTFLTMCWAGYQCLRRHMHVHCYFGVCIIVAVHFYGIYLLLLKIVVVSDIPYYQYSSIILIHVLHDLNYCGFINFRWVSIFVVFVDDTDPRKLILHEQEILRRREWRKLQNHEFKNPWTDTFSSNHENWYPRK